MILCLAVPVRADAAKKAAIKPKALIVDYRGENDTRVGKCLKKAGFKVYRIRRMKKVRKMKPKPQEGTTQEVKPEEGTTQDLPPEEGTTQDSGGQDPAATTEKK